MRYLRAALMLSVLLLLTSQMIGLVGAQRIDLSVSVNGEDVSQGEEIQVNESVVIRISVDSEQELQSIQASIDDRSSYTGLNTTSANITYRYRMVPPGENALVVKAIDVDGNEEEIRATVFRPADSTAELMWHLERLQQELDALEATQSNLSDRKDMLQAENERLRQENEELRQQIEEESGLLPLPGFTGIVAFVALITTAIAVSLARKRRD